MMEELIQDVPSSKGSSGPGMESLSTFCTGDQADSPMDLEESSSPALSSSMEELVDLDQLLAELSAKPYQVTTGMEHSQPNSYSSNTEDKTDHKNTDDVPVDGDYISDEAWNLLGELDCLNDVSDTVLAAQPLIDTNKALNLNMDYFQNSEFYDLPMISESLKALESAADSADCTVVHNPLLKYLSGDACDSPRNCKLDVLCSIEQNVQVISKSEDNFILLPAEDNWSDNNVNNEIIKIEDTPVESPRCSDPISPFLLPTEESVCINSLLSSTTVPELQQPTTVPLDVLGALLSAAGVSPDQYSTVKLVEQVYDDQEGQTMFTIVLDDPSVQPQPVPSVSPELSVASDSSLRQSTRKRKATGKSCRSVLLNSATTELCGSAEPSTSREDFSLAPKSRRLNDDEESDDRLDEMRKKNNEASRKSRKNRREREQDMEKEVVRLTELNKELKQKLEVLEKLVDSVKQTVIAAISQRPQ